MRLEPVRGFEFPATITHTFVNGHLFMEIVWNESKKGRKIKIRKIKKVNGHG